jgi:TetR/AcrR family tetracycline transcriptional repressor
LTRDPLGPEAILRAALALVDAEGLDALTMRRLAADLGVATMSLYSHVPNKDDLVRGVLEVATGEMALPGPGTPPWEALRTIAREFRRVALLHPNLVPLITRTPPAGARGLGTLEATLEALGRSGMAPAAAARAYRLLASFVIGFVSLESGGFFRPLPAGAGGPTVDAGVVGAMPGIVATAPYLADWDSDDEFEAGIDVVIGSLAWRSDGSHDRPPPHRP